MTLRMGWGGGRRRQTDRRCQITEGSVFQGRLPGGWVRRGIFPLPASPFALQSWRRSIMEVWHARLGHLDKHLYMKGSKGMFLSKGHILNP